MKNKLAKLMGVVLTAMTVVSLFAFAVPASAAITPQTWTKQALPGATGLVMPNNVVASGLLTTAPDGTLFMYERTASVYSTGSVDLDLGSATVDGVGTTFTAAMVGGTLTAGGVAYTITAVDTTLQTLTISPVSAVDATIPYVIQYSFVDSVLKSNTPTAASPVAGRSWTAKTTAGPVTSLVTFASATGYNVYYTTATQLFRSQDSGATYINIANVIGGGTFTAIDVAAFAGRNIIILGTTNDVYFVDEADPFFNLVVLGTPDFAGQVGGQVLAVKAAPSFGTDRGVAAISTNGKVSFDVMGGAWGGIIYTAPAVSGGTVTAASIHFTSDWNSTTLPNFYFAISGGTAPGFYAFRGGVNVASSTIQLYAASATSTAQVTSLDVTGTYAAATIYLGIMNDATHPVQLAWSTNSGVTWTSPTKLQSLTTGKAVYVVLDNNFATSNMVYVLVGGTGLLPNDQTGFYYSVDKGVSFNQISLINNTISTVNDLAASSGTTFVSTSFTAGTNPTPAIPAGSIVFNSGSMVNTIAAAAADSITITSGPNANANPLISNVIFGYNSGSMPTFSNLSAGVTWNPVTNTIVFSALGQSITITATAGNSTFVLTGWTAGVIGSISTTGTALVTGADPNFGVTESGATAAGVTAALSNSATITLAPNPGALVNVVFNPLLSGTYTAGTGVIAFTVPNATATVTLVSTTVPLASTVGTVTYTSGSSSTVAPTYKLYTSVTATSFGASGSATPAFVLGIPAAAFTGTNTDTIWRWDGTNFERVFVGFKTNLPTTAPAGTTSSWSFITPAIGTATMVRVSSAFATDKTVFYAAPGGIYLSYSTDAGQTWKTQTSAIGSSNGTIDQINSLLVVDGNTQYVGSNLSVVAESSRIIKSTTNGAGNILNPAWSEVILKNIAAATLTGAVTEISVASNGDLVAVVTDPAFTYVFKSTDAGATWKGLSDPTTALDATLPASSTGAFVDPAADYATTGNIFVTLNAGGVYRYPSTALAVVGSTHNDTIASAFGWQRVDGASYDANGAVGAAITNNGEVVAAGGPGDAAEGSGMVYATDSSGATQGVSRIRGLSTQAEALLGPVTFTGLWASSNVVGNVQLWTIDNGSTTKALYTYVDTLNVAGGAVTAVATGVTTGTISWTALANATNYKVVVNDVKQNVLYSAVTGYSMTTGVIDFPVVSYTAGTLTATVNHLVSNTTYYVSVWAITPVSSFIFGGATAPASFTTPLNYPLTPTDPLVPTLGATNIPLSPNFAWNTVPGATSYTLQITSASDVAFASPIFNSATIPVVTGPSATFTYLGTLSTGTSYLWRVKANGTTGSDWVYGNFSTIAAVTPPVTVTQVTQPAPTIVITQQPQVTITIPAPSPAPVITVTQPSYTLVTPTAETPTYIWIIVGVGALLTLAVIILIIRTRRVV
jgi:hypothetical protein